ncbi:T4 RnlA family RNA ligase [Emticicia sp. 17c]|uniref:T4 RnlA family RNA ligase n=1 Tax=Emticicia sp. 17c TaxID=3127704 RepID=UPI00301CD4E5
MNTQELQELIANDYINVQKHHEVDLYIYNYTPKAQYEKLWNDWTLACRGLIMNAHNEIVARPFKKFFNWEELSPELIPQEPFEVYEKMDGSLGILYWINDIPYLATRGSFNSEQAKVGTRLLHTEYASLIPKLDKTKTYLFEIIYPENRIVVDYGNKNALILLAVIDTLTGKDVPLGNIGFETAKHYDGIHELALLKQQEEHNKEGFVIKFKNGFRLKVKFNEYHRIHQIVTKISNIDIWDAMQQGQDLLPLLEKVPDEFYDWVKKTQQQLLFNFEKVENQARNEFKIFETRKEAAIYYQSCTHPAVLFKMMENKPYQQIIWKMIKPKFEKPFANRIES